MATMISYAESFSTNSSGVGMVSVKFFTDTPSSEAQSAKPNAQF
jgi:hypothetical protein